MLYFFKIYNIILIIIFMSLNDMYKILNNFIKKIRRDYGSDITK